MAPKKKPFSCNSKDTRKRKSSAAESSADFSSKFCNGSSDAVELKIKTVNKNKKSLNCKAGNLVNNVDFDQITLQSPSSNKFTVAPKKKTLKSNIKGTRKKKATTTEPLADFSSKTEFCNAVSDAIKPENKTIDSNKKSSNCKTFDLLNDEKEFYFDEMSEQTTVQSFLSNKLTVSQKKRICRSNIKTTTKRKTDSTDSLTDFTSKIEFSNAVELENKTKDNKISSNCKTFNLVDDFKNEFDFEEKSEQTVVQSSLSNKITVSDKKRTCRTNIKATRKRKPDSLANISFKTEFCNGISDAVKAENKSIDSNKMSSSCKTFNLLDNEKEFDFDEKSKQTTVQASSSNMLIVSQKKRTFSSNIKTTIKRKADSTDSLTDFSSKIEFSKGIKNKFDKKSDQVTVKSLSTNKLTDTLSKSNSSLNIMSNLGSIIDKVENLQIHPSIHVYSIMPEGQGLSAVDVSQNLSHLAYSFPHSHEIHIFSRKSLSDGIARNDLRNTWLNLTTVGKSEEEKISSPQEYIFSHNDDVSGLRFSYNDNLLLSCSLDGSVKVISTITYQVLEHYNGYGLFTDIDVNASATQFVTTSVLSWNPFHMVYVYNFERKSPVMCFSGHENSLKCVRFHPNGLYIATAAADNCIKLWSAHQSKEVRCFKDKETAHPEKITFSPDGKYIASTHSGCVKIWDIASGKKLKCLETSTSDPCNMNVCYNYIGNLLAAGGSDEKIHIWNVTSDENSEMMPEYDLLKSENLGKRIFSIKYVSNFFSCVTG